MNKKPHRRSRTHNLFQRAIRQTVQTTQQIWQSWKRRPQCRTKQQRRTKQLMEMALLLIWVLVALLLSHEVLKGSELSQPTQFDAAFNSVVQLEEITTNYASVRSGLQSKFGIPQATYDIWRQSRYQPYRDVTELSQAEAETVYQDYWQQGQCHQYQPPLDVVCLDSMISFGVEDGSSFLQPCQKIPRQPRSPLQIAALSIGSDR